MPIAASEYLPGTIHSTAQLLGQQAVDIVRASVPWRGGITDMLKIARMAAEIEAARQLMYHVAHKLDNSTRLDKESSMVKWFAAEMAERVTSDALQIFGGAGYTKLYPIERYWRDARLTKIFEGTSEIQLRIISDRLLGKPTTRQVNS